MTFSGKLLSAVAGIVLTAGCNQSHQARVFDDGGEVVRIRQWQADASALPEADRGRYLADRMAGLLPDETLASCPPRR